MLKRLRRFIGNRRKATRRLAQRKVRLVFSVTMAGGEGRTRSMPVEGYTRDISESGLALIVPSLRVADTYLTESNCKLRIVLLNLPTGELEIEATPVRHQELGDGEHLIGVRITRISDNDRARLVQFLSTLSPS
jgi:c-di-GMP-binding flagellar brake protein YcgR